MLSLCIDCFHFAFTTTAAVRLVLTHTHRRLAFPWTCGNNLASDNITSCDVTENNKHEFHQRSIRRMFPQLLDGSHWRLTLTGWLWWSPLTSPLQHHCDKMFPKYVICERMTLPAAEWADFLLALLEYLIGDSFCSVCDDQKAFWISQHHVDVELNTFFYFTKVTQNLCRLFLGVGLHYWLAKARFWMRRGSF